MTQESDFLNGILCELLEKAQNANVYSRRQAGPLVRQYASKIATWYEEKDDLRRKKMPLEGS